MINTGYTYIFLCQMIQKYTDLSVEAKTEEGRLFAKEQLKMFKEKYKLFKN
jgi:hypothetical protein